MNNFRLSLIALACAALACNTLTSAATPTAPPLPTEVVQVETPVPVDATVTSPPPTAEATVEAPATTEPTPEGAAPELRLVIAAPDHSAYLADLDGNVYPTTDAQEPLYVYTYEFNTELSEPGHAYNVSSAGVFQLDAVQEVNQGFAAYVGPSAPNGRLAWDSYTLDDGGQSLTSQIHVSSPDGSDSHVALEEAGAETVLRVWRWSADGSVLYFSKEPTGLGGYILFAGVTNVWALSLSDGAVREVMPAVNEGIICIDDLSSDEEIAADHCSVHFAAIEAVGLGNLSVIGPPPEAESAGLVGDVRLSPDGVRAAFALAVGNPDAEQGWVAVSDGGGNTSHLVATADAGEYFKVVQWLDADTLLLQSVGAVPGVYKAAADGSGAVRLGDGWLLGVIDNLPGQP